MSVTSPNPELDPTLDFVGLFADQTEDVILNRMIDWANEGLDPVADADAWVDTRQGAHWRTTLTPAIREIARLYDLGGTEVPMSAFVLWAWEVYLDDLAAVYDVFRLAATPSQGIEEFTGPPGTLIDLGTNVSVVPTSDSDTPPVFETISAGTIPSGGVLDLPVQATQGGKFGDVAATAVTVPVTPLPGVTVTNPAAMIGGTDPETDDSLRSRTLTAIAGKGPGNAQDYVRWAGGWPGVGKVSVVPVFSGAGTVLVMVSDPNGQPLPAGIVAALQTNLDPIPGQGAGTAPVGAQVTVETSTLLNMTVDATITFQAGYTWDGAGGTVAVGPGIQAAIIAYFLTVQPGGTVRNSHVAGIISTWPGVDNVTLVKLNGGAVGADVAVSLSPPKVPVLVAFNVH